MFSVEATGLVYNKMNSYTSGETSTTTPIGAFATHDAAYGDTPLSCTTDGALPSSSNSGC